MNKYCEEFNDLIKNYLLFRIDYDINLYSARMTTSRSREALHYQSEV